ncbi:MAG: hypothetical protein ACP5QZ_02990 [Candidatus Sumerlaeaceae bacterium]
MKWLYHLLLRLLMAILLIASVLGMLVSFPLKSKWFDPVRDFGNWLVERILAGPHMVFWFWFGLFWAIIAIGALASLLRRRTEGVAIAIEDGRVVILESAIRKFLRTALRDVANFQVRNIDIYQMRNRLYIDLYAQVVAQARVPEVEETVVGIVKRSLREQLGIEQDAVVQLYVTDFTGTSDNDELVYRRRWDEKEETAGTGAQTAGAVDVEPESLAMGWGREEPELERPVTRGEADGGETASSEQSQTGAPKQRRGFWSLFGKGKDSAKKSDQETAPAAAPCEGETSPSEGEQKPQA